MQFPIICSLQYSININTVGVDPHPDLLHIYIVKPKNTTNHIVIQLHTPEYESYTVVHDKSQRVKPVTDEQVFYDKFLYGKFYLQSARVYVRQILYDTFLVF